MSKNGWTKNKTIPLKGLIVEVAELDLCIDENIVWLIKKTGR